MADAPKPPAHISAYVDLLGSDLAMDFLLRFGGAELYLSTNPRGKSEVERMIGREKTIALAERASSLSARIPLAKPWLAAMLRSKGLSKAEIALRLHVSDVTVRKYLAQQDTDQRQGSLF